MLGNLFVCHISITTLNQGENVFSICNQSKCSTSLWHIYKSQSKSITLTSAWLTLPSGEFCYITWIYLASPFWKGYQSTCPKSSFLCAKCLEFLLRCWVETILRSLKVTVCSLSSSFILFFLEKMYISVNNRWELMSSCIWFCAEFMQMIHGSVQVSRIGTALLT